CLPGPGRPAGAGHPAPDGDPGRHPDRVRRRAIFPVAAQTRAPRISRVMAALELMGVDAVYPGRPGSKPVLAGINLRLEAGEVLALIGPNGAGKSTLLRVAAGGLRPAAGRVLLEGRDLSLLTARERARHIAVVAQDGPIPSGLFVREMVSLGRTPYARLLLGPTASDRTAVDWALSAAGVERLADRFV